jgi:diguanylate cyclase (GGDEF)-like protein
VYTHAPRHLKRAPGRRAGSEPPSGPSGDDALGSSASGHLRLLAAGVLGVGLCASVLGAFQWRSYISDQQRHEVQTTTSTAKASLTDAIQRDEDLVETLQGIVASGTPVTNSELQEEYSHVAAFDDAGVIGLGYIARVPLADLKSFEAEVQADPPLGESASEEVVHAEGRRADYCLIRDAVGSGTGADDLSRAGMTQLAQQLSDQFDYCAGAQAATFLQSASTGDQNVVLLHPGLERDLDAPVKNRLFDIVSPIYAPGLPLGTSAERNAALLGWVDGVFSTVPVLGPVIGHTSGVSVALYYHDPHGAFLVDQAGPDLDGAPHSTVAVSPTGLWRATITVLPSNASATVQGIGVLADLLVIVLLVGLIILLFRSRQRAFGSLAHKNAELQHRAQHDSLTGLANRELLLEQAGAMLERAEQRDGVVALLLIDLDGFKSINDTYGHRVGDQVIQAVAERLSGHLGQGDVLGRPGADEFVVLAGGPSIAAGADALAERLLAVLSAPIELAGGPGDGVLLRLTACIGVAQGPRQNPVDLLRDADTALHEAKGSGRNRFVVFQPAMHMAASNRLAMSGELRSALEEGQFFLVYQPVFELAGGRPIGVEALLRWRHPLRGVVPPLEFVPLLEETGMIADVGREVLRLACGQAKTWERRGLPIFVSVNVSAIQLESEQFSDDVRRTLEQAELHPSRLTIEITESALMRDAQDTVRRLGNLKALGVRLAIDDFGTGYSSLAYLRQFPVDILKIDRAFVSAMTASAGGMALVRTMLELARALGLRTVAEGIEQASELRALEVEHCRFGQGFLLARPLDPDQIELFFDNARPRAMAALAES